MKFDKKIVDVANIQELTTATIYVFLCVRASFIAQLVLTFLLLAFGVSAKTVILTSLFILGAVTIYYWWAMKTMLKLEKKIFDDALNDFKNEANNDKDK